MPLQLLGKIKIFPQRGDRDTISEAVDGAQQSFLFACQTLLFRGVGCGSRAGDVEGRRDDSPQLGVFVWISLRSFASSFTVFLAGTSEFDGVGVPSPDWVIR